MNYTDFDFYELKYKGDLIPLEEFEIFSTRASEIMRKHIFNRNIKGYEEEVQKATCSVAEILYKIKEIETNIYNSDKEVKSESVGDYSRTFNTITASEAKVEISNQKKEIDEKIRMYLFDTGLLYRGV